MKPEDVLEKSNEHYAYGSVLEAISRGLYPDRKHILREFVQNAYDGLADLKRERPRITLKPIEITAKPPSLIIADKGFGMSEEKMRQYRYLGFSEKQVGSHAGFRGIGKFSAISACDRVIVHSSRLGDPRKFSVEIDAKGIFEQLNTDKNPPLEAVLQKHSSFSSSPEESDDHYTFVELHGIRPDAAELLDEHVIRPYITRTAPVPFEPEFPFALEISERLTQVCPNFLEVPLHVNGIPVYKPFLRDASRPEYIEVLSGQSELLAYAWFSHNLGKGQFPKDEDDETAGRRHPFSGLHFRVHNFAVGDAMLVRKSIWHTAPERAFYFVGEIHVLDQKVIPTSDRVDFEDNSARGTLYGHCQQLVSRLNIRADVNSQKHRLREVVAKGEQTVDTVEEELKDHKLESDLKEQTDFSVQKLLEDLAKRLERSKSSGEKDPKTIRRAKRVIQRAQRVRKLLRADGDGHSLFVNVGRELKFDRKSQVVYDAIIETLREELRAEPQRFALLVRKIHEALRTRISQ
jgi:hypothetical protein